MTRRSAAPLTWTRRAALVGLILFATSPVAADNPDWPPAEELTAEDMADPATWPDDPGYGYDSDHTGRWVLYSFTPTQSGNRTLRPAEQGAAAGMSVDLAWRWTTGDDSVVVAITDSGIKWNTVDLIDRVRLNLGELTNHKPSHADSSPCGGTGPIAEFDCNGDGIASTSDYAETPSLQPPAGDGQVLGDMNHNGVLDAGDLILNFSDTIDDDGNGYVDDIAGWDFLKDDNDPYDDVRYGHGSNEMQWAAGEGNNGVGEIGACPHCRVLPMRVGDTYIADLHAFAQAVVYATDNGASAVVSALGPISVTRFAQQAIDYAWDNDVLVCVSMADENSRHHNSPSTANHVLPIHAIRFTPGKDVTNVETFVAFHTGSNYGGQNLLSGAGEGMSSEAVGNLGGIVGLLFSAAIERGLTDPLTAAEALQLLIMRTDDIDVPESRDPDDESGYFWSHPGFDQRFGYGRVNANKAVEWLKDGRIPPRVDIVSPLWFQVLHANRLSDAVPIQGTIAAPRANSYDYLIEWAPGVQPLDEAFQLIAEETNVPPDVITGDGEDPLAELDVRTISTEHEADVDSPHGENAHTITVRIRATAHYGGAIGDVPGEMRRTLYVLEDPDLLEGFPIYLGDSGEGSAKLADLDGDGVRDIVYATAGGEVHVYRITPDGPEPLPGFPFRTDPLDGLADPAVPNKPNYRAAPGYDNGSGPVDPDLGRSGMHSAPAIGDLAGDGALEIVVTTWNGFMYVIDHEGALLEGWPKRLPEVPSCPLDGSEPPDPCMDTEAHIDRGAFSAPVLADMNADGALDIIQSAFDGFVYVFEADGTPVDGWPVEINYTGDWEGDHTYRSRILATPAVADFNDDGLPELVLPSTQRLGTAGGSGATYVIDGRGTGAGDKPWLPNWPVSLSSLSLFPVIGEGVPNSAIVGRLDDTMVIVTHGNGSAPLLLPADPGEQSAINQMPANALPPARPDPLVPNKTIQGLAPTGRFGELSTALQPNTMFPALSQPALGDIDQDGTPDLVSAGSSLNILLELVSNSGLPFDAEHLLSVWSGKTGEMLPASPMVTEDFSFFNSSAIADLNNDDYPEIIAGTAGYFLHAFDGCGREPEGWPKFTGQWIISTPAVGDVDGDDTLEVVIATRSGWLYAWHTEGRADGIIPWESFRHDNYNTGNLEIPLAQGDPDRQADEPLTVDMCRVATETPRAYEPSGGCGCRLGATNRRAAGAAWLASLLGLAAMALRRRRR